MKLKICGLFRECDIEYVNEARPDFIGFVFAPSRRQVSADWVAGMRSRLRPEIKAVGVFVDEALANAAKLLNDGIIDLAQFHGHEDETYIRELKAITAKPLIKAVQVKTPADIQQSQGTLADYLLFDQGSGSGQTFDWNMLEGIIVKKPFFLAGGLNSDNVEAAMKAAHPYALDLSSGVEIEGKKDRMKILEVVRRVRHD